MADDGSTVQITLKDVYQQQQGLEKSLGDSLSALNLTLTRITGHLERIDLRNTAADQLNKEHGERLTKVETILAEAQPVKTFEANGKRITSLERFKYLLLGALILLNAATAFIEYTIQHHG